MIFQMVCSHLIHFVTTRVILTWGSFPHEMVITPLMPTQHRRQYVRVIVIVKIHIIVVLRSYVMLNYFMWIVKSIKCDISSTVFIYLLSMSVVETPPVFLFFRITCVLVAGLARSGW